MENWEKLSSLHHFLLKGGYPQEDLEKGWQLVLRNQFHDILPGSSIKEVYEDSKVEYESLKAHGEACLEETRALLTTDISLKEESVVVYNLSWYPGEHGGLSGPAGRPACGTGGS